MIVKICKCNRPLSDYASVPANNRVLLSKFVSSYFLKNTKKLEQLTKWYHHQFNIIQYCSIQLVGSVWISCWIMLDDVGSGLIGSIFSSNIAEFTGVGSIWTSWPRFIKGGHSPSWTRLPSFRSERELWMIPLCSTARFLHQHRTRGINRTTLKGNNASTWSSPQYP